MSFNPAFKYTPLPNSTSIRLLVIHPGAAAEPIHCSFFPCDLDRDYSKFANCPESTKSIAVVVGRDGESLPFLCDFFIREAPGSEERFLQVHAFQRYRAISYVWGPIEDLQTIHVQGEAFLVTPNLMAALQKLRPPTVAIKVWIDAICINQADPKEMKSQIPLMSRIYEQAESTWAQILPSFDRGEDLCRLLDAIDTAGRQLEDAMKRDGSTNRSSFEEGEQEGGLSPEAVGGQGEPDCMAAQCGSSESPGRLRERPQSSRPYAREDFNLPSESSPLWKSWRQVFASPYFRRIWVQQEVVLSEECEWSIGDVQINAEDMLRYMLFIELYDEKLNNFYLTPSNGAERLRLHGTESKSTKEPADSETLLDRDAFYHRRDKLRDTVRGFQAARRMLIDRGSMLNLHEEKKSLIDLLYDYRFFCATDERDIVFGLLGLANDASAFYDLVNYTSSTEEIFISFAEKFVEMGHGAKVLSHASSTESSEKLPSWVPVSSPSASD